MTKLYITSLLLIISCSNAFAVRDSTSTPTAEVRIFHSLRVVDDAAEFDPIIIPKFYLDDSTTYHRARAQAVEQEVNSKNAFVTTLNGLSLLTLPVGIQRNVGGLTYTIIISKIISTPSGSLLEAYMMLEIPAAGEKIAFRGSNIPFSNSGGLAGSGRLDLVGDYPIEISNTLVIIRGNNNTFVEFDCNGFQQLSIAADVEFSRDHIIPEDNNGNLAEGRVTTSFIVQAQSWSDILVGITLPPFQVKGLKGVGFSVLQAYIDWSDIANPPGIEFPQGYFSGFALAGQPSLWRGVYIKQLSVRLPPSFSKRTGERRVSLGVENMLIDDQGFSGLISAEDILSVGDLSGWAFTIDELNIGVVSNQVTNFQLSGLISIPNLKAQDTSACQLSYSAQRAADGNYAFAVTIIDSLKMPFMLADVTLLPGSSVSVIERENTFIPTALLHGELSIRGLGKDPDVKLSKITFQGLRISGEAPHFDIQSVGFPSNEQQSVSKFPIVINSIGIRRESNRLGLDLGVQINVGGSASEEGFSGGANITVWAKQENVIPNPEGHTSAPKWKFDNIQLSGVSINISKPDVYQLHGMITFFENDAVYGKGFAGSLSGSLGKMGGLTAHAMFGKTETFRYWYADALITLEKGPPIIPGVLFANAFGGGLYSKMKQTTQSPGSSPLRGVSGVYYIPDATSSGIKAIMKIATVKEQAMNGEVGLEIVLNTSGGINSITLTGNANFMSLAATSEGKLKELMADAASNKLTEKLASLMKGQVCGSMRLVFDNENDVFHGTLEIYVNVALGLLKGVGTGGKAGWAVLHFEQGDWYIMIGTPNQPIGLEVARIFQATSYFMLGKNLPGSPPPPSQVSEILGNVNLDYMRDMNALESGTGFAFGLHFQVDTGDLRFLMFYARFAAGAGVDFMLKDYGEQYHCAGSSGPIGIDGWYANGQAYAYLAGKIGIKVNLKFYKGNYDILDIGAAAVLQAKGPNPFWMKGIVGGRYKILGGMVKGNCRFEVTVGKECTIVGEENLLDDVNMISELSPAKNATDVDVFTAPQVAFNIPVNEIFEINDEGNETHYFRAKLGEFVVTESGSPLDGSLQWNEENDVVIFDAIDILPGQKKIKAKARLTFEERINGVWTGVIFNGAVVEEVAETEFTTGPAPDYIPPSNVSVSYPLISQRNFLPREFPQGFIQLGRGQSYLFEASAEFTQKIRFTESVSQRTLDVDFTYAPGERKLTFGLPGDFANSKEYKFEVINEYNESVAIDANVLNVETDLHQADSGSAVLTTKSIEGNLDKKDVKVLFTSDFRTSKYNTFVEKLNSITLGQPIRFSRFRYANVLSARIFGDENFQGELTGNGKLIHTKAVLTNNAWYNTHVFPTMYQNYPFNGWRVERDTAVLGIPPVRDIVFEGSSNQLSTSSGFTNEIVVFNMGESVELDFSVMKQKAANYVLDRPELVTPRIERILIGPHPYIRYGAYRIKLDYKIPGINTPTSTFTWELFNNIPDSN